MKLHKKSDRSTSKKSESKSSLSKYYTSIADLPVWNWWQLHEKKDASFILLDKKSKICDAAKQAIELLQDDFIGTFGIETNYAKYLRLKCDIELDYIKQALTGNMSTYLLIRAKEERLKLMEPKESSSNYFKAVVALEKFLGRKIEIRKESTYDVYSYLKEMTQWQKVRK